MCFVYLALILIVTPKVNSSFRERVRERLRETGGRIYGHAKNLYKNVLSPLVPQPLKIFAKPVIEPVERSLGGIFFGSGPELEQHNVMTEDGYILTVFRIPGRSNGKPVLIQHGLLQSSKVWLIPGKGKSLDMMCGWATLEETLIPEGTDISPRKILDSGILGMYDIPAVITYITDLTQRHLFYIGHSMGGTTFSAMAIERPDVAKKVTAAFLLAPGTCGHKITSFLKYIAPHWHTFKNITESMGLYEFLPHYSTFNYFANFICTVPYLRKLCAAPLFTLAGENREKLDDSLLPEIWRTFPAGTSNKLFTHYLQLKDSKKFRKFDYGPETNKKIYNKSEPPEFDLSRLYVNVTVFWSPNDRMVVKDDIYKFYDQLPIKGGRIQVADTKYNHFDFLWANDAPKLVYSEIIKRMKNYRW